LCIVSPVIESAIGEAICPLNYHCNMAGNHILTFLRKKTTYMPLRRIMFTGLGCIAFAMPLDAQLQVRLQAVQSRLDSIRITSIDSLFPAALFATVYRNTLQMQRESLADKQISDSMGMLRMTEVFFLYFDSAVRRRQTAIPNPIAWETALRTANNSMFLHAMLLGIHAHVYNDLAPALKQAFDAEGLKAFRRDFFRMNRGFRCINRQKEKQLSDAMRLKHLRKWMFRFGSRWMMRQFKQERSRAFRSVRKAWRKDAKGKTYSLVNPKRIQRNLRRMDALFKNAPLNNQLRKLDLLTPTQQLNMIMVRGCRI
jgi:hypothetical protein